MIFANACRFCLSLENVELIERKVQENNKFLERVNDCVNIKLLATSREDMESLICNDCSFRLIYFSEFRSQCAQKDQIYRNSMIPPETSVSTVKEQAVEKYEIQVDDEIEIVETSAIKMEEDQGCSTEEFKQLFESAVYADESDDGVNYDDLNDDNDADEVMADFDDDNDDVEIVESTATEYTRNSKTEICRHCQKGFNLRDSLIQHYLKVHKHIYPLDEKVLKESPFKEAVEKSFVDGYYHCTECSFAPRTQDILEKHMLNAHFMLSCEWCDYSNSRRNLIRHIPIHLTVKLHHCKICDYSSKRRNDLLNHEKTHIPRHIRSSKCDFCELSFVSRSGLHVHIGNNHSDECKYVCTLCNKRRFNTFIGLTNHKAPCMKRLAKLAKT